MFGRGSADSKSNVIAHVGALRAWDGRPPVGIKLVIEGQEEVGSALNTLPPDASRAVPLGRDADRRHGERPAGRADADVALAGHGDADDRGGDARRPEALGPVRRRGAGCADRAPARARLAARRARGRRRRRAPPRGVDRGLVQRGRVPRAGGGAARFAAHGERRARLARLVRPGDHRHRDRRALRRERAQCRLAALAGEPQRARPPRAGRRGGAGGADPPPPGRPPVRDRARSTPARSATGSPPTRPAPPTRRRARPSRPRGAPSRRSRRRAARSRS